VTAPIPTTARSTRTLRLRALAPRLLLYGLVAILSLAGLRQIVAGPASSPPPPAQVAQTTGEDLGAQAFAESFTRAYLTWQAGNAEEREHRLDPYLPGSLDADAGLSPGARSSQDVLWTTVLGDRASVKSRIVTVEAQTTGGRRVYLSVPVARDDHGYLYVATYPAFVGPPATADTSVTSSPLDEVEDATLVTVVKRALTNYLAQTQANLLADLTPDAVISLPPEKLRLTSVHEIGWLEPGRKVAAEVQAEDGEGSAWTLRYELEVTKSDRWYVRALEVDPTFQGGR
jgi:hypothetical protein